MKPAAFSCKVITSLGVPQIFVGLTYRVGQQDHVWWCWLPWCNLGLQDGIMQIDRVQMSGFSPAKDVLLLKLWQAKQANQAISFGICIVLGDAFFFYKILISLYMTFQDKPWICAVTISSLLIILVVPLFIFLVFEIFDLIPNTKILREYIKVM